MAPNGASAPDAVPRCYTHATEGLKEPLRGIVGDAASVMQDSAALDDATAKRLNTIHGLALRMDEPLDSLLEYSRLGRADLRMASVSLDDVLDDVEELLAARFVDAGVQLRRPMGLGTVSSDRIRLQEVLVNLITNGIKYAAAEPPRWVEVGCEAAVPPDGERPVRAFYVTMASASQPSSRKTSSGSSGGCTRRAFTVVVRALG